MDDSDQKSPINLKFIFIAIIALSLLFHVKSATSGYPHYRDIHVGTALEYARHGLDFFHPVIVGFDANNAPTPQEIPLWQLAAGVLFRLFGPKIIWANLLSFAIYLCGIWPLYKLAKAYLDSRGAWWTLVFFAAQPIIILFSGTAGVDGLVLTVSLWFMYFCDRLIRDAGYQDLILATVFGILLAVIKLPYFVVGGATAFFILLCYGRKSLRRWLLLAAVGVFSGIIFLIWSRYIDYCYSTAVFPEVNLRMNAGSPMWRWYFGDWAFRLGVMNWVKGGWAALNCLFGSFLLIGLVVWALIFSKNRIGQLWLVSALLATLVFSHLFLVHRHYYLIYSPAIALLCASGAIAIENSITVRLPWHRWIYTFLCLAALLFSSVQGLMGMKIVLNYDHYAIAVPQWIKEKTSQDDKLLIVGGSWGGDELFRSGRNGLSISNINILANAENLTKLRNLGFNKLVIVSESPLLNALEKVNPGSFNLQRETWNDLIIPEVSAWPTLFQTEDIIIKEIPKGN